MKSKTFVIDKKAILAVILVIILFFAGWFIGRHSSKCKCDQACCKQEQNINQHK